MSGGDLGRAAPGTTRRGWKRRRADGYNGRMMNMNGTCLFCGRHISVRRRHVFCSQRCQSVYRDLQRRGRTERTERADRGAMPAEGSRAGEPAVRPIAPTRHSA